jgi:hypothetical protein
MLSDAALLDGADSSLFLRALEQVDPARRPRPDREKALA